MLIVSCIRGSHGGKHGAVIEATARGVKNGKWRAMVPRHSVTEATSDRKAESNRFRGFVARPARHAYCTLLLYFAVHRANSGNGGRQVLRTKAKRLRNGARQYVTKRRP